MFPERTEKTKEEKQTKEEASNNCQHDTEHALSGGRQAFNEGKRIVLLLAVALVVSVARVGDQVGILEPAYVDGVVFLHVAVFVLTCPYRHTKTSCSTEVDNISKLVIITPPPAEHKPIFLTVGLTKA